MSSKIGNSLSIAIGAAVIGSLSLSTLAAASPVFQASDLASGYMLAAGTEGKCGEGKCGMAKLDQQGRQGLDGRSNGRRLQQSQVETAGQEQRRLPLEANELKP